jgi:hypothetical protein
MHDQPISEAQRKGQGKTGEYASFQDLRSRWLRQECDEQEEHDSGLLVTGEASLQLQRRIPLTNLSSLLISAQSWLGVLTIPLLASSQFAQSYLLAFVAFA